MVAVWTSRSRTIFVAAVLCLIALNLVVLAAAYPETTTIDSGCCGDRLLAKDFSAFYTAAWRLIHDPGQVYTSGYVNDGEYHILPQPESYKYLPSFLLMVLPFTALSYQQALTAFDVFQFLLLPLIALLVYELTKEKGVAVAVIVAIIALLVPSPSPHWSLSATYYWQWAEGQSKVLETFLLLLGLQLGKSKRPLLSGVVFGLSAFDPRFALLALPLFFMYNRPSLWKAFGAGAATPARVQRDAPGAGGRQRLPHHALHQRPHHPALLVRSHPALYDSRPDHRQPPGGDSGVQDAHNINARLIHLSGSWHYSRSSYGRTSSAPSAGSGLPWCSGSSSARLSRSSHPKPGASSWPG